VGDLEEERGDNATSESEDEAQRLVASLDLIVENADFISLE
jgi:hypothetical protein